MVIWVNIGPKEEKWIFLLNICIKKQKVKNMQTINISFLFVLLINIE